MKKLFAFALIPLLLLSACSQYAEPEVSAVNEAVLSSCELDEPSYATLEEAKIIFGTDFEDLEDFSVCYSSNGGCADMLAIFKLESEDGAQELSEILSDYKSRRYEDFKGYAPQEAEKIENGKVLVYGRYVILAILSDIDSAQTAADSAFKP